MTYTWKFFDVFWIMILPCPVGFVYEKHTQMYQYDPVLEIVNVCNIDDQTILRPASSWIVGSTNEHDHHTYQVSSQCPFDYCLPHSSHLDLSNPDSQCQFNRTGLLCGRCKEGLSILTCVWYSTYQCKNHTNYYLFRIISYLFP